MSCLLSGLVCAEIFLVIFAVMIRLRRDRLPLGEALAFSIAFGLAGFGSLAQLVLASGVPWLALPVEVAAVAWAVWLLARSRDAVCETLRHTGAGWRGWRIGWTLLGLCLFYLLAQAFLLPPVMADLRIYHLPRVLMAIHQKTLFLHDFTTYRQVASPWGFDALAFYFLRFHSDFGLGVFPWLSYVAVLAGTFALVQRMFKNRATSTLAMLVIAGLWELAYESTFPKNDVPCAALALVAMLAGLRFLEERRPFDVLALALALIYGIEVKGYFPAFDVAFLIAFIPLACHRLGWKPLAGDILRAPLRSPRMTVLTFLCGICLAMVWAVNLHRYGGVNGPKSFAQLMLHHDGIAGALANMFRYVLGSLELPRQWGGEALTQFHDRVLGVHRSIAVYHAEANHVMLWRRTALDSPMFGWYGPLGFLLVIPSILLGSLFGKPYVRVVAISLLGFFALFCYKVAWHPNPNGRYLEIFFAGSGLCVGWLIHRWLRWRPLRFVIAVLSFASLGYVMLLGGNKSILEPHPGGWLYFVTHRDAYYHYYNTRYWKIGPEILDQFEDPKVIPPGSRVLLAAEDSSMVFSYLLRRPDLDITVSTPGDAIFGSPRRRINIFDPSQFPELRNYVDFVYVVNYPAGTLDRLRSLGYLEQKMVFRKWPQVPRPNTWFALYQIGDVKSGAAGETRPAASVSPASASWIFNGDFSQWQANVPTQWRIGPQANLVRKTGAMHENSNVAELVPSGENRRTSFFYRVSDPAWSAGSHITASIQVKSEEAGKVFVFLVLKPASGGTITASAQAPGDGQWHEVKVQNTVPSGATIDHADLTIQLDSSATRPIQLANAAGTVAAP